MFILLILTFLPVEKMAGYRKYRKRYSRKRKTLSNYHIATRTSAKAQSRQIYAIKRRINYIQRLTKPEIVIAQHVSNSSSTGTPSPVIDFSSAATGVMSLYWNAANGSDNFVNPKLDNVPNATNDNKFIRLNSFFLGGTLQYSTVSATVRPFALRVVIVQTRATRQSAPDTSDIFSGLVSGSLNDRTIAVYGPLQNGLARTVKVLSDKRYILSYQRPNVVLHTSLKRIMNMYYDLNTDTGSSTSSEPIPKGAIFVFIAWHSFGEAQSVKAALSTKTAFTDA